MVAVAAGEEAKVTLKPTHGCSGSPTIQVAVRAPVEGAIPGDVAGWTATAEPDGNGNTVLRWTGGSLPADQTGTFTVPDTVGALLMFPSVQYCDNGDELAWISGDPAAEFPAPRLLVLPTGSDEAETLDDVPADAPGRDQLIEVVDVDNPLAPSTTPPAVTTAQPATTTASTTTPRGTQTTSTSASSTTIVATLPSTTSPSSTADSVPAPELAASPDDNNSGAFLIVGVAVVAVAVAATVLISRRRRS